jgi:hypothetical protein
VGVEGEGEGILESFWDPDRVLFICAALTMFGGGDPHNGNTCFRMIAEMIIFCSILGLTGFISL